MKRIIRWFRSFYGVGRHRKWWAEALESGKYKQGHGRLRLGDQWCCLAVACDVFHQKTGRGQWVTTDKDTYPSFKRYEFEVDETTSGAILPYAVAKWYGFGIEVNPRIGGHQSTHWNDYVRLPFAGIARLVKGQSIVGHFDLP